MPRMNAALLALAVSAVVAGASFAGQVVLALAVVLCQALLVSGWHQLIGAPDGRTGPAVVLAAGAVSVVLAVFARDEPTMAPMVAVLALALVAAIVGELGRYDSSSGAVVRSLSATVTGCVVSVLSAGLVAERGATLGLPVTVAAVLAAGLAACVAFLPLPPGAADLAVFAAAGGVGVVTGLLVSDLGLLRAVLLCLLAGSFGLIGRRIAASDPVSAPAGVAAEVGAAVPAGRVAARHARQRAQRSARRSSEASLLVGASLPVLVAAPGTYVLGRLLVG